MLNTLLPAGTRLYMESPLGARLSGITLTYGHWEEPRFTFPDTSTSTGADLKGRESIREYHMLGYYRRYVSPSEQFRPGSPKDYLFVAEGRYAGQSLTAVDCEAIEEEPLSGATAACVAEPPPCVAEPPPCEASAPPCVASPPPCVASPPPCAIQDALERIRVREAALLAELADLEKVRVAQERLAALESRVAAARAVLNSV
jgi:hypothetical protein